MKVLLPLCGFGSMLGALCLWLWVATQQHYLPAPWQRHLMIGFFLLWMWAVLVTLVVPRGRR